MKDTAATPPPVIQRRSRRWVWVLLVVSLAVNFLLIGIAVGTVWSIRHGGAWDAPAAFVRNQRFMKTLPFERRREVRRVFFAHWQEVAPQRRALREARVKVGRMISEGSYTPQELSAAIDDVTAKEAEARTAAKPMIIEILSKLRPEERQNFLRAFLPMLTSAQGGADDAQTPAQEERPRRRRWLDR